MIRTFVGRGRDCLRGQATIGFLFAPMCPAGGMILYGIGITDMGPHCGAKN